MRTSWAIASLVAVGCTAVPAPREATQAAPPAAVAQPASEPARESIAKADALLADLKAREAALAEAERKNPPPPAPSLPASTPGQTLPNPARGEAWWKQEVHARQEKLDEDIARMVAAEFELKNAIGRGNYEREQVTLSTRRAAVAAARDAVERLREEAKLLNIPPAWLTWP